MFTSPEFVSFLGILGGALTIAGILGAVVMRWRTSADETAGQLWREEAAAWKARAERTEETVRGLERRIEHLEAENKMLRALHDNREELNAMRDAITQGFAAITQLLVMQTNREGSA